MKGESSLLLCLIVSFVPVEGWVCHDVSDCRASLFHGSFAPGGCCSLRENALSFVDGIGRQTGRHPLCFLTTPSNSPLWRYSVAGKGVGLQQRATARHEDERRKPAMAMTETRSSKLNQAIVSAEERKSYLAVWNDELFVDLRGKDERAKSSVRRVLEIVAHLLTRAFVSVLLQFWAGICSLLHFVQRIRPNGKSRAVQPAALVQSLASKTSELQGPVMAPSTQLKTSAVCDDLASRAESSAAADGAEKVDAKQNSGGKGDAAEIKIETASIGNKPATIKELASMREMRARLEQLAAEGREDLSSAWIQRLQTPEQGYELLSYVRKTRCRNDDCWRRILASAKWRKEFNVDSILDETTFTIQGFFQDKTREVDWMPAGTDTSGQGNPFLLYRSAAHVPLNRPTEEWLRFFVYQCEYARLSNPEKQVVILVDRVGSGRKNQDPTVLRALSPIISDHFPLLIGRVYVAPVNTVLFIIWRLVSLILDEETKSGIQLVQGKNWKERLAEVVLPSSLPVRLGGHNEAY